MLTRKEIEDGLPNFIGSENFYRHIGHVILTDGAKWLAENAGAYWLMDAIASYQGYARVRSEPFQVWRLKVKDQSAVLTCDDGNDNILVTQRIAYTDFPLPEVKLYAALGDGRLVVMLPQEY
jgi:hypothetical protein